MKRVASLFALLAILATAPAWAQVPSTMSYQGVLTDGAGNLVPDGAYNLTFKLYDVPVLGAALWTETQAGVTVTKGGFAVILGIITPIALPFDKTYYLGIAVGANPEMTPRITLASSPYGLSLRLPFDGSASSGGAALGIHNNGAGAAIVADPTLQAGTAVRDGYIRAFAGGQRGLEVGPFGSLGSYLHWLNPTSNFLGGFEPDGNGGDAGYFWINGGNSSGGFYVDGYAGGASTGPYVSIFGPSSSTFFDTNSGGDAAVSLPADAVSSGEILDEPGISQGRSSSVTFTDAAFSDAASTTITIPAPGYIVLEGDGQVNLWGTALSNYAHVQITQTTPGVADFTQYGYLGFNSYAGSGDNFFLAHTQRVFYKGAAGAYTFYFQLKKQTANGSAYIWQPTLRASYYPTSYGTVTAVVANGPESAQFSSSRQVISEGSAQQPGSSGVQVDLRELELRAAQARADAERAERQLLEARIARQHEGMTAPKPAK